MKKRKQKQRKVILDPDKLLVQEKLRLNLLLSSLYLAAFEILKSAIIDGTKDFFIYQNEVTEEDVEELKKKIDPSLANRFRESYVKAVARYENEVGIKLENRDLKGLIPSCKWLQKQEVLTEKDIESVRNIREHRNEVAHELPTLLISKDFDVNLDHFQQIRQLLHKVDVFWARNDLLIDPTTLEEVDTFDIPDNEIMSGRVAILEIITNTVVEYLNAITSTNQKDSGE